MRFNLICWKAGPEVELLPLDCLRSGEFAFIAEIHGDPVQVHRLEEMGLRPGAGVRVLQAGRPIMVQVGESRLSLRMDGLEILVQPTMIAAAS